MTDVSSAGRALVVFRCRQVGGRAAAVLLWLLVGAAVALAISVTLVPLAAGGRTLTVLSGSMSPAIPAGSVVVVRPVDPATLSVGDVISYATTDPVTGQSELVTHRVIAVSANGLLTTQGDANQTPDDRQVTPAQVRGEAWFSIPYLGSLSQMLLTRTTAAYAGAGALLVLGIVLLRSAGIRRHSGSGHDHD